MYGAAAELAIIEHCGKVVKYLRRDIGNVIDLRSIVKPAAKKGDFIDVVTDSARPVVVNGYVLSKPRRENVKPVKTTGRIL